jgi:hypothetical protein
MSAKTLFRCLVAISLICSLASLAVTQFPGQVPEVFDSGTPALRRTTEPDGVFCYTFFKAVARKGRAARR